MLRHHAKLLWFLSKIKCMYWDFFMILKHCDSLRFILQHKISDERLASEINLHTWVGLFPLLFQAPWPWNDADFPSLMASELRDRIQLTLKTCPLSYSVRKYYLEFVLILILLWKLTEKYRLFALEWTLGGA